ncbi:MAG: hypothetical protein LAP38_15145 [Acidobacteriia bacterium]|nr:hypothetical protein [Terriglobia bacterium]
MRRLITVCLAFCGVAWLAQAAEIPEGTLVRVRLGQTISSDKARSGDMWAGTVAEKIVVRGKTVARRGDPVEGRVVEAKASGRLSGTALLELQLVSIHGIHVVSDTYSSEGGSHKGRDAKAAGGGAVAGAIIGAIAGGGKGAAIGLGAGAAAGTAGAAATGKKDVSLRVETILDFTIR